MVENTALTIFVINIYLSSVFNEFCIYANEKRNTIK